MAIKNRFIGEIYFFLSPRLYEETYFPGFKKNNFNVLKNALSILKILSITSPTSTLNFRSFSVSFFCPQLGQNANSRGLKLQLEQVFFFASSSILYQMAFSILLISSFTKSNCSGFINTLLRMVTISESALYSGCNLMNSELGTLNKER